MSSTLRPMRPIYRNAFLWVLIFFLLFMIVQYIRGGDGTREELAYSDFITHVQKGRVMEVTIDGRELTGELTDKEKFVTVAPNDPELVGMLREAGVAITVEPDEEAPLYLILLGNLLPFIFIVGMLFFFMNRMQGGGKSMTFGKSRAKLLTKEDIRVMFADVAGIEEAKEEVSEIVEFLKNPRKFTKLGGRIPKGVLLMGPPGTGKTLLAKAIAGEAGVPFFSISGSDFVEMFVGVGASRVRDLFIQGKKSAPCIIFVDEIDAVGRHRGAGLGGGHDEREQTLNQLLVEMDGFESSEGVILVAATNRPDVLDPALLRPGRFDRQVVIPRPDINGRAGILKVHTGEVPVAGDVDLTVLARGTPGFSGADLENLVNEAALFAARAGKDAVEMEDFEKAKDKVLMGTERKSMVLSEDERKTTAYHEAGHALVGIVLPHTDPVHKVSIIPRGRALGVTVTLPIDERHNYSRQFLVDRIAVCLGGRAAEELFLGQRTTGAANDIEQATELARRMVCKWGMSDKLGPLAWGREEEQVFLGKEMTSHKDFSEKTAREIDNEVRALVEQGLERARLVIDQHREALEQLAVTLLEQETLGSEQVEHLVREAGVEPGAGLAGEEHPGAVTPQLEPVAQQAVPAAVETSPVANGDEVDPRQETFSFVDPKEQG